MTSPNPSLMIVLYGAATDSAFSLS
jgi:hypothetical protein